MASSFMASGRAHVEDRAGQQEVLWEVQGEWQPHRFLVDSPAPVLKGGLGVIIS